MKTIAVLLTVHNRKEKTLTCLQHLFAQHLVTGFEIEVFMVDDGCTDGTAEAVAMQYPSVHIVKGSGDLYWNRGMHKAWQTAAKTKKFDFYLWLNDDTILVADCLKRLLNHAIANHKNIVVGSTAASDNKDKITYGGKTKKGKLITPSLRTIECSFFNGNIVLVPKEVFEVVGFNDPYFQHSLGDFDYGLRARKLGINSFVAPGILGLCDAHDSLPTWCNPKKTLKRRWTVFRSPLGQNPEEFFVFERRHNGLVKAIFHYGTNHLRMLCPWIWNIK